MPTPPIGCGGFLLGLDLQKVHVQYKLPSRQDTKHKASKETEKAKRAGERQIGGFWTPGSRTV